MTPDAVGAVASLLSREWGDCGYRFESIEPVAGGCVARVVHSDGSRFQLIADRWGNAMEATSDHLGDAFDALNRRTRERLDAIHDREDERWAAR